MKNAYELPHLPTCRMCDGTGFVVSRYYVAGRHRQTASKCKVCHGTGRPQAIARLVDGKTAASGERD